ncbi:MAG TPA: hypothetical protein PK843_16300 [bacterium]|nr:hypothetical protein [bacterium]
MLSVKIALVMALLAGAFSSPAQETIVTDPGERAQCLGVLREIGDWAIDAEIGSGALAVEDRRRTSIFTNSNLGRVLLALYDLTQEERYKTHALAWFDHLAALQQITLSSRGDTVGYWGDLSPTGNIYLGDAGTSATALAGAVRYAQGEQRCAYLTALQRYADFVRFGCQDDPQGKNRGGSPGWILTNGDDAGAIGCGYYRGQLSVAPYTIATSVTGAAFFSAWYELTGNTEYLTIAEQAVRWLLKSRMPDGEIPYRLHNRVLAQWPLDTMSYVGEGLVSVYRRSDDSALRNEIVRVMQRSLQWLLNRQERRGVWGRMRSEDQQRSQGVLTLLIWHQSAVAADRRIANALSRNLRYFLDKDNRKAFGVNELPIATGFVGLGIAEALQPGVTYRIN